MLRRSIDLSHCQVPVKKPALNLRDDSNHVQDVAICVAPNTVFSAHPKAFEIGTMDDGRVAGRLATHLLILTANPLGRFFFVTHSYDHRPPAVKAFPHFAVFEA